jgi:hypothetical protein
MISAHSISSMSVSVFSISTQTVLLYADSYSDILRPIYSRGTHDHADNQGDHNSLSDDISLFN